MVAALTLGAFAPAAGAATAEITDDGAEQVLHYTAAATEVNKLVLSAPHTGQMDYMFTDTGAGVTITPGAGCVTSTLPASVTCSPAGLERIEITLTDGADDLFVYSADVPVTADLGADNDLVEDLENAIGTPARTFIGGAGNDYFVTSAAGRLAHDYQGGADTDTVDYAYRTGPQSITLDNAANDGAPTEGDNVHSDVENVLGGSGAGHDYRRGRR